MKERHVRFTAHFPSCAGGLGRAPLTSIPGGGRPQAPSAPPRASSHRRRGVSTCRGPELEQPGQQAQALAFSTSWTLRPPPGAARTSPSRLPRRPGTVSAEAEQVGDGAATSASSHVEREKRYSSPGRLCSSVRWRLHHPPGRPGAAAGAVSASGSAAPSGARVGAALPWPLATCCPPPPFHQQMGTAVAPR